MTPDQQTFLEGYLELVRRYAFITGYLEALEALGVDPFEGTEVLLELIEVIEASWVVEVESGQKQATVSLYHPEDRFIRMTTSLSPPEACRAAA